MAKRPFPRGGARHAHAVDDLNSPSRDRPPPGATDETNDTSTDGFAESLLLLVCSPEELARLTPAERRLLIFAASDELPQLSDAEQEAGERRYRTLLLKGLLGS